MKMKMLFAALICSLTAAGQVLPAAPYSYDGGRGGYSVQLVTVPDVPEAMSFAGETVPLANRDTRESLQKELIVTAYMQSRTLASMLAATRYFPVIEPIMKEEGIPADFKYLCVAESSLTPNAVSVAKAAGLWQFMPATGKEFGLEVNDDIDERYHIEKSTRAACKYLKDAYAKFGSWTLAAASYNMGTGGLSSRMQTQKVKSYYDLFLPEETMRYVFRILSLKQIMENPLSYGYAVDPAECHKPYGASKQITVSGANIDWSEVAAANGTTYKMLREYNPWIRTYTCPNRAGKSYSVKIPGADARK